MSGKNIARALALMILFSALFFFKIPWSVVTNPANYDNPAGQFNVVMTLPFWLTILGAGLLAAGRAAGVWLVLVGTLIAIVGHSFSYIPFVPWFAFNTLAGLVAMHSANLVIVFLIWHYLGKRDDAATSLLDSAG